MKLFRKRSHKYKIESIATPSIKVLLKLTKMNYFLNKMVKMMTGLFTNNSNTS